MKFGSFIRPHLRCLPVLLISVVVSISGSLSSASQQPSFQKKLPCSSLLRGKNELFRLLPHSSRTLIGVIVRSPSRKTTATVFQAGIGSHHALLGWAQARWTDAEIIWAGEILLQNNTNQIDFGRLTVVNETSGHVNEMHQRGEPLPARWNFQRVPDREAARRHFESILGSHFHTDDRGHENVEIKYWGKDNEHLDPGGLNLSVAVRHDFRSSLSSIDQVCTSLWLEAFDGGANTLSLSDISFSQDFYHDVQTVIQKALEMWPLYFDRNYDYAVSDQLRERLSDSGLPAWLERLSTNPALSREEVTSLLKSIQSAMQISEEIMNSVSRHNAFFISRD